MGLMKHFGHPVRSFWTLVLHFAFHNFSRFSLPHSRDPQAGHIPAKRVHSILDILDTAVRCSAFALREVFQSGHYNKPILDNLYAHFGHLFRCSLSLRGGKIFRPIQQDAFWPLRGFR